MSIQTERIAVESASGVVIHNRLYAQTAPAGRLMVLLPGANYDASRPLLYYPMKSGLQRGYDVLSVQYYYHITQADFEPDHLPTARKDAEDALMTTLKRGYDQVIFVAKSIGTLIAADLIGQLQDVRVAALMLTPIGDVVAQLPAGVPALGVIGTSDAAYTTQTLTETDDIKWQIFDGLNHSLEVAGDWRASLSALPAICEACDAFITRVSE